MQSLNCALVAYNVAQVSSIDAGERGLYFHCESAEHGELWGRARANSTPAAHADISPLHLSLDHVPGSPLKWCVLVC